jgi:hypothetical protein
VQEAAQKAVAIASIVNQAERVKLAVEVSAPSLPLLAELS